MLSSGSVNYRDWRLTFKGLPSGDCHVSLQEIMAQSILAEGVVEPLKAEAIYHEYLPVLENFIEQPVSISFLQELGARLAELLPTDVKTLLSTALQEPSRSLRRVWLSSALPYFEMLPWEFLVLGNEATSKQPTFLGLHPHVVLLRLPFEPKPVHPLAVAPLRVMLAWADPNSPQHPKLAHIASEVRGIRESFEALPEGYVKLQEIPYATPDALERALAEHSPHILHFIGHAERRPTGGRIVLHGNRSGAEAFVYSQDLAQWVIEAQTRLVILSACWTGASTEGFAYPLLRQGVPAVLGMQFPLRDSSAGRFAQTFYRSLIESSALDTALLQGRQALQEASPDWAVPVLYTSTESTTLFHFPPIPSRHNLPTEERKLIGRRKERSDLRRKVLARGERLITLTGMGGIGKTHLALKFASELLEEFPGGAWLIECHDLKSAEDIVARLCVILGVSMSEASSPKALGQAIATRKLLLVLDGFETCIEYAFVVDTLLREAPHLYFLITSRQVLDIPREFEYPLEPLPTLEKVRRQPSESVALFAEAAAHIRHGFSITSANKGLIRELCIALEGIPLAIILATGWLRQYSLVELHQRVHEHRLDLLKRGASRTRQSDLKAMILESFRGLPREAQRLLKALSVFASGFYGEDVNIVCQPEFDFALGEGLQVLQDHSLLQVETQGALLRFRVLDTVREALEEQTSEEYERLLGVCRARHAEHYMGVAQNVSSRMGEGKWSEGIGLFWREIANFRGAISYCRTSQPNLLLAFSDAVSRTYFEVGLWADFEALVEASGAVALEQGRTDVILRLRGLEGALARRRQEEEKARGIWEERLSLAQRTGASEVVADALIDLAVQAQEMEDRVTAVERLQNAMVLCQEHRLYGLMATIYVVQSEIALSEQNTSQAERWAREAEHYLALNEDRELAPYVLKTLGRIYRGINQHADSERVLKSGIATALEGEYTFSAGWLLLELGGLYETQERFAHAGYAYTAAQSIHAQLASRLQERATTTLLRFQGRHDPAALRVWLRPIYDLSWKNIVQRLLEL